ncbi:hypothetical protein Airi02_092780 [Actinoallomurus iriomotensis]|uniref:Uncharacterized protein n=1 Tax=Actinoallomurus iriomotensis TaxID=478107 RepID=A0A9W6SD17_9ACTN|nr:hypothetical protein Airi02_092780 [Actinoallomurus iriomotensis]
MKARFTRGAVTVRKLSRQSVTVCELSGDGRRIAVAAIRLPMPCSAGDRFLPAQKLKGGVSSEDSDERGP